MAGYRRDELDFGVTLHRLFINDPDELGSRDQWNGLLFQHYNRMPFRPLWDGLDLWIWDMRHPDLVSKMANKQECLLDYNLAQAGKQVAAGLYFNKDRLEIGVFPDNWSADNPSAGIIQPHNITKAIMTLSHEIGHFYAGQINYPANPEDAQICKDIGYSFNQWRPKQAESAGEDFAECYRALFGGDWVLGYFSDNKRAIVDGRLITLLRTAYWLVCSLSGSEYLNLRFDESHAYWDKVEWVLKTNWFFWTYWEKSITGRFRLNHKWQTEKLVNNVWIPA